MKRIVGTFALLLTNCTVEPSAPVVLTAEPDLAVMTERAGQRWSDATGLPIWFDGTRAGGTLHVAYGERTGANGHCCASEWFAGEDSGGIRISRSAWNPERTIMHEIGHALGAWRHLEASDTTGVLHVQEQHRRSCLTEHDLDLVCSGAHRRNMTCAYQTPECD